MIRAWKSENGNWLIGCTQSKRYHIIPADCIADIQKAAKNGAEGRDGE